MGKITMFENTLDILIAGGLILVVGAAYFVVIGWLIPYLERKGVIVDN